MHFPLIYILLLSIPSQILLIIFMQYLKFLLLKGAYIWGGIGLLSLITYHKIVTYLHYKYIPIFLKKNHYPHIIINILLKWRYLFILLFLKWKLLVDPLLFTCGFGGLLLLIYMKNKYLLGILYTIVFLLQVLVKTKYLVLPTYLMEQHISLLYPVWSIGYFLCWPFLRSIYRFFYNRRKNIFKKNSSKK